MSKIQNFVENDWLTQNNENFWVCSVMMVVCRKNIRLQF